MKKKIFVIGAAAIALIVLLSSTAVSQVNGEIVNDIIESEEECQGFLSAKSDLSINSIEDILVLIDLDGFADHFTSENFANFITSPDVQDLIASDLFLDIYDTQIVQDFIQSDVFIDYLNTDEAQTFLSNYFDDQNPQFNAVTNENILPLDFEVTIDVNSLEINGIEDLSLLLEAIFWGFVGFIFGIITFIPVALMYLIEGILLGGGYALEELLYALEEGSPNPFARAAEVFIIFMFISIGLAFIWPFWCAGLLMWQVWENGGGTIQMITEEQILGSNYMPTSSR